MKIASFLAKTPVIMVQGRHIVPQRRTAVIARRYDVAIFLIFKRVQLITP